MYAVPPKELPAIEECRFYHVIELPGLGLQPGAWDLRPGIDHYLGALIYPQGLTPAAQVRIAVALALFNVAVYGTLVWKRRRRLR